MNKLSIDNLANGLTVIIEEMPDVSSVAYELHMNGGILNDPAGRCGASLILSDLISRGAGQYSTEKLSEIYDENGIVHGEGAGNDRIFLKAASLAEDFEKGIELMSLMLNKPLLPEEEIETIRPLYLFEISTLKDSPQKWVMSELSKRYFTAPYDRPSIGIEADLNATTINDLTALWKKTASPNGSVISIAGNISRDKALKIVEKYLIFEYNKDSSGKNQAGFTKPDFNPIQPFTKSHITNESAQTQIALAYPSAEFGSKYYYTAKVVNQVLSGGMFGRLFIEVREKRGLCYAVSAGHRADNKYGMMLAYAGTTPERANETLSVLVQELKNVKGSVTDEEILRAKSNLKAGITIGEEASGSRAGSNVNDWWVGKRVRSDQEIMDGINAVTQKEIDEFCEAFPVEQHTLVTLGSKEL